MRHLLATTLLLMIFCLGRISANAQIVIVHPSNLTLLAQTSPALQQRIDNLFADWNKPDSPGCAVAAMREGHILFEKGYGAADLQHDVPISPTTVFHVGSIAKQITALAVLLLAEKRELSLDDDIRKYLPEMPDYGVRITIRNLIYHTSGIRDQWDLLILAGWREGDVVTEDDVIRLLTRQTRLNFRPGTDYSYSNSGYTLLAAIVRRVSQQALSEFAEANIFRPLGMRNTQFLDDYTALVKGRADGYKLIGDSRYRTSIPPYDLSGPTNLLTTVEDLARWDENFYTESVGGRAGIRQMVTPGQLQDGRRLPYAFGLQLGSYRGLPIVEHDGTDYGYTADFLRFPEQRFAVACLCNGRMINAGGLARAVAELFLSPQMTAPNTYGEHKPADFSQAPSANRAPEAAGTYQDPISKDVRRFVFSAGKLYYAEGEARVEMIRIGSNEFQMMGAPVYLKLVSVAGGHATRILLAPAGEPARPYERVKLAHPTAAQLQQYSGNYYSPELDNTFSAVAVRDGLLLRRKKFADSIALPLARDSFEIEGLGTFAFTRDGRGKVSGFLLTTERSRGISFVRRP